MPRQIKRLAKTVLEILHWCTFAIGWMLILGCMIDVWRAGLKKSAVAMALMIVCIVMQAVRIAALSRSLEQKQKGPKP